MIGTGFVHLVAQFAIEVVPLERFKLFQTGKTLDFRAKDGVIYYKYIYKYRRISEDPYILFSQLYKRHLEKILWQQWSEKTRGKNAKLKFLLEQHKIFP